jgi:hypothetical protein
MTGILISYSFTTLRSIPVDFTQHDDKGAHSSNHEDKGGHRSTTPSGDVHKILRDHENVLKNLRHEVNALKEKSDGHDKDSLDLHK